MPIIDREPIIGLSSELRMTEHLPKLPASEPLQVRRPRLFVIKGNKEPRIDTAGI